MSDLKKRKAANLQAYQVILMHYNKQQPNGTFSSEEENLAAIKFTRSNLQQNHYKFIQQA